MVDSTEVKVKSAETSSLHEEVWFDVLEQWVTNKLLEPLAEEIIEQSIDEIKNNIRGE